jgi:phosphatidylserine decarboxylase
VIKLDLIELLYKETPRKLLVEPFFRKKFMSELAGWYADTRLSSIHINSFIKKHKINIDDFVVPEGGYKTFNEFFTREFKKVNFPEESDVLPSPAEGYLLAYEHINPNRLFQAKGETFYLDKLLNRQTLNKYTNGTMLVCRLEPKNYHRFHFVDSGVITGFEEIPGEYYTVSKPGLENIPKLFCRNTRHITNLNSWNFGDIAYAEIGATFVGSIKQYHEFGDVVRRGRQKGYFKFGGSTVILVFEENKVEINQDIIKNTNYGKETEVKLGENIGSSPETKLYK